MSNQQIHFVYYHVLDEDVKISPEIPSDMKAFSENALKLIKEYVDIPPLKHELLGKHVGTLYVKVANLPREPVNTIIERVGLGTEYCWAVLEYTLEELSEDQRDLKIDIIKKKKKKKES